MMLLRVIGAEGRRDALVRFACAVLVGWAAPYLWTVVMVRYSLAPLSMDYLRFLLSRLSSDAFMAVARVPDVLMGFGIGLLLGVALALLFRRRPLGVAIVSGIMVLVHLALPPYDYLDSLLAMLRLLGIVGLPIAAGLLLPAWLMQRRRERVAATA